jgi:hypothetical protein
MLSMRLPYEAEEMCQITPQSVLSDKHTSQGQYERYEQEEEVQKLEDRRVFWDAQAVFRESSEGVL